MQYVADLHLHSKYSRAVSQNMTLPIMVDYALQKGLDILSASDFTHTLWIKEIKANLEEASEGLYKLKNRKGEKQPFFLLSTEIASIGNHKGRLRRIHNLVFSPNLEVVEKINQALIKRGCNLTADGRPIIGLNSKELLELILEIDERCMLIPCHIWTPHFGIYGSASGYDSIEECFDELSTYIYGIETGLSSDPEMNWQVKELMNRSILSFSDAHSPAKMGREATVFTTKDNQDHPITYEDVRQAIMRKSSVWRVGYSIEFYPEEGKYHFSGHRNCKVVKDPQKTREEGNICSVCKRKLTEGVLYRVEQLSDNELSRRTETKMSPHGIKWYVDTLKKQPPYVKLVPLNEIIAEALSSTVFSQKTKDMFDTLCNSLGSEINILLKIPLADIEKKVGSKVAEGIKNVREGNIVIDPGYDGEYGKVSIWQEEKEENSDRKNDEKSQLGLF